MEINKLAQQARKSLVANMGEELIQAYLLMHYPELSQEARSRLLQELTSTPIARKGKKTAIIVKPETRRQPRKRVNAKPIPGQGGKPTK